VIEIQRIETEVSLLQAERVGNSFNQFLRWLGEDIQISKIDTNMLNAYQRDRLKIVSRDTVDKDTNFILRLLKNNDIYIKRPKIKGGKKIQIREFTKKELIAFFNHCENPILRCLFLMMLSTGARPTELIPSKRSTHKPLLKDEIDLNRGMVTIRSAKIQPGQQGKVRKIKISYELCKLLKEQIKTNQGDYVFPYVFISREFNQILKNARISQVDNLGRKLIAHSFRHTYASFIAEEMGGDQFILKELLGHTQIRTTERYVHTRTESKIYDISYLQKKRKKNEYN
jgi:integrase